MMAIASKPCSPAPNLRIRPRALFRKQQGAVPSGLAARGSNAITSRPHPSAARPHRAGGTNTTCQAGRRRPGPRRRSGQRGLTQSSVLEYAVPALGLLAIATLTGPLLGAILVSAMGVAAVLSTVGLALGLGFTVIPFLVGLFGLPALLFGGAALGVFAGTGIVQLALIGTGLYFGSQFARLLFAGDAEGERELDPNDTIDVEWSEAGDDWKEQVFRDKERERAEKELRDFDDLLRQRDEFTRRRRDRQ
eukprot:scaffold2.g6883.t1